ncbi:hypothetical protein DFH09DRAFT_1316173 [Mycena vulgaris]|nr:hypothetical protein DFH09DRAFT_1316173 [Mycena vulgaris]
MRSRQRRRLVRALLPIWVVFTGVRNPSLRLLPRKKVPYRPTPPSLDSIAPHSGGTPLRPTLCAPSPAFRASLLCPGALPSPEILGSLPAQHPPAQPASRRFPPLPAASTASRRFHRFRLLSFQPASRRFPPASRRFPPASRRFPPASRRLPPPPTASYRFPPVVLWFRSFTRCQ